MDNKELIERLERYGADMDGIRDRFMGDAELFERCYTGFLEESNFELLKQRIAFKEYEEAFQSAHALKGLSGNLGLSPFYRTLCVLVESLRAHEYENVDAEYADVLAAYDLLLRLGSGEPMPELEAAPEPEAEPVPEAKPAVKPLPKPFIESKRFIPTIASLMLLGVLLVILLFYRLIVSYKSNTDIESAGHLIEITRQIDLYVEESIANDWRTAYSICNSITQGADSPESIYGIMKAEKDIWRVSDVFLYTEDGYAISATGDTRPNDAASQTVYLAKKQGEFMSIVKSAMNYTIPVSTDLTLEGAKIAAVSVEQNLSTFLDDMDFSSFDDNARIYLTQPNGAVISYLSRNAGSSAYNFVAMLDGYRVRALGGDEEFSTERILSSKSTDSYLMEAPEGSYYLICSPVNTGHEELRLFYMVPESVVNKTMSSFSDYVINLCVGMILIFALSISLAFFVIYRNRKKQFNKAIVGRDRMFDLLVQNTSNAFALLSTEKDEPIFISSNAKDVIGSDSIVLRKEDGGFSLTSSGYIPPKYLKLINSKLAEWNGKTEFVSDYIPADDGEKTKYYVLSITPVKDSETDFVGIAQDVTQNYERELAVKEALAMAERSNKAKDTFLSNMSHDFRTPLNAIMNMTDFAIANRDDPVKQLEELKTVKSSSVLLLEMINKVLDMSRIESGQVKLDSEPFDIRANLADVCSIVKPLCKEKNQTFITDFKRVQTSMVMGDQLKLSQIFINLLSNAVKFTPKGGAIRFTAEDLPSLNENVSAMRFIVEDNGIGINKEALEKIFIPFERADDKRVHNQEGTGLGLPICKSYVTAMGGSISCESEPENGSTFTVELVFRRTEEKHGETLPQVDLSGGLPFVGMRCLLCEDNPTNQLIARSLLEKIGFMVETADDGRLGLQKFLSSRPGYYDIIYMDIQMPNMDGYQASVAIRESEHPRAGSIPIVGLSANVFAEDIEKARLAGMNGYVGKPIIVLNLIDETFKVMKREEYYT